MSKKLQMVLAAAWKGTLGGVMAVGKATPPLAFALGFAETLREDFPATEEGVALKFDLELVVRQLVAPAPVKKVVRPVVAAK